MTFFSLVNVFISSIFILGLNTYLFFNLPFNLTLKKKKMELLVYIPVLISFFFLFEFIYFSKLLECLITLIIISYSISLIIFFYFLKFYVFVIENVFDEVLHKMGFSPLLPFFIKMIKYFFVPLLFLIISIFQICLITNLNMDITRLENL
jgi:hypothetical protein